MTRFRALNHRNFQTVYRRAARFGLSERGMQTTAQLWLVYDLNALTCAVGEFFGFANQIPMLVLASVGGYVGDRYSRHRGVIAHRQFDGARIYLAA